MEIEYQFFYLVVWGPESPLAPRPRHEPAAAAASTAVQPRAGSRANLRGAAPRRRSGRPAPPDVHRRRRVGVGGAHGGGENPHRGGGAGHGRSAK